MKKTMFLLGSILLCVSIFAQKRIVEKNSVVPAKQVYNVVDSQGKNIKTYKEGDIVATTRLNCVKIECPPEFGKGVVCWVCKSFAKSEQDRKKKEAYDKNHRLKLKNYKNPPPKTN